MCGIVGYMGTENALPFLIDGLERLEYRGYDSAGVALLSQKNIQLIKCAGKLENLKQKLSNSHFYGNCGIGHTRWATHGAPDSINAHPHLSCDEKIAVVHNGIIENYKDIRAHLIQNGFSFSSDTDTEVIPNLISYYFKGDFLDAVIKATEKLKGSYAISVLNRECDEMIAVRADSPLVIGTIGGDTFVASDMQTIMPYTNRFLILNDGEFACIRKSSVKIYNKDFSEIPKEFKTYTGDALNRDKQGFSHYMLKEIYEQPQAVKNCLSGRIAHSSPVVFDGICENYLNTVKKIYIVACGTAYHAGLTGKAIIETFSKIPVETDIASEFRYRSPLIDKNTLVIVISQSGETADTIAGLRLSKLMGAKVLAVTNVKDSTIAREADFVYLTKAGAEIAVASTKAYTTQLTAMYNFALFLAQTKGTLTLKLIEDYKKALLEIPGLIERALNCNTVAQRISKSLIRFNNAVFMGRGLDYASALEGALKLREVSYIHSFAHASGELKHGSIALIDNNVPVLCICTQPGLMKKNENNVKEVKARDGRVTGILSEGISDTVFDDRLYIPSSDALFAPLISQIPFQLIAYHTAINKGLDPDKPRNLAKSVTVE